MFEARFITEEGAKSQKIRVEDYSEMLHKGRLLCADFNCAARVYYRSGGLTRGAAHPRAAHFCSHDSREHRPGCTHDNPDMEQRGLENLKEALQAGKKILINLNLKLSDIFARAINANSPYERFCLRHSGQYFAVSAKSVNDIMRIRDVLIESGHKDALARTYVGHCGQVCPFDDFFIDGDGRKLKALFNSLRGVFDGGYTSWEYAPAFPRVFRFRPTRKTQENGRQSDNTGWFMNGTPYNIAEGAAQDTVLLQEIKSYNRDIRSDILRKASSFVLGIPAAKENLRNHKFRAIIWRITDEDQYAAAP